MNVSAKRQSTGSEVPRVRQVVADEVAGRDVSARPSVDTTVAVVIVVGADTRFLPATIGSVLRQSVLPGVIVVADCSGQTSQPERLHFETAHRPVGLCETPLAFQPHTVQIQLLRAAGASCFADAVNRSLQYAHLLPTTDTLWLLHDDSRPVGERCLHTLIEARRNAPTASVLGAKELDWQAKGLHGVGSYIASHHVVSLVVDGEPDQNQYDMRRDVFAVPLAGALVTFDVWRRFSPACRLFGIFGESIDFCRRICLGGGRVVVVPRAAMAHRRARYEGLRGPDGRAIDVQGSFKATMAVLTAQELFYVTDFSPVAWPWVFLWRLLRSWIMALSALTAKEPHRAWCELRVPWRIAFGLPTLLAARRAVSRVSRVVPGQLAALTANHRQLTEWRARTRAFASRAGAPMRSPLAREHLRSRRRVRVRWMLAMVLAVCAAQLAITWDVTSRITASGSIRSDALAPTGATWGQLLASATSLWSYGSGLGLPSPPAPFLTVLLGAGVLTAGHVAAAMTLVLYVSGPAAALSFWALAGVFTRSNPVRASASLLWWSLAVVFGLYQQGNLPMLVVMAVLPAVFASVFHAMGMYRTEETQRPHPSVRHAALAALCAIPAVAAEPQLLLPLCVVFLIFLASLHRNRTMLLLIPVPAALVIAPTLVNALRYAADGAWRQIFGDMTLPSSTLDGSPASLDLMQVTARAWGFDGYGDWVRTVQHNPYALAVACSLLALAIPAFVALTRRSMLCVTRMMWSVALAGALLSLLAARVAVAVDAQVRVAGSVLPGMALMALGAVSCGCALAGTAAKPFAHPALTRRRPQRAWHAGLLGRGALAVTLLACAAVWMGASLPAAARRSSLTFTTSGLPLIAVDYLRQDPTHRVLALRAESEQSAAVSVMRTVRGDLIDNTPAVHAMRASGHEGPVANRLSSVCARLMASDDDDAVAALSRLGFGGIYVTNPHDRAGSQLASNVTASEGTESVVSAGDGVYVRLTGAETGARRGIDMRAALQTDRRPARRVWLWCTAVVLLLYILVVVPRPHGRGSER